MLKNIPITLLIVVLIAVIGGSDASCACFSHKDRSDVAADGDQYETISLRKNDGIMPYDTGSRAPGSITGISDRLSKKHLITMSLIGAAVVLISSFAVHSANNSVAKYDIVKEAKQVSSALESSSGSKHKELDRITEALCTKLFDSPDTPPLDTSTLAAITQNAITGGVNTDAVATYMRTTEAMTTPQLTTDVVEPVCKPAAEKIFEYIKKYIGKLTGGFIVADVIDENDISKIRVQLNKTAEANCEADFFQYSEIGNHQGLSFNATNKFINSAMNNDACKKAVDKILPVLYGLGHDPNRTGIYTPCTLDFETNEMKTDFLEGAYIANGKSCGRGFFRITGDNDEKRIQYENSNTYINQAWPHAINDQKCQERADSVITLLKAGGHDKTDIIVQMTANNTDFDTAALKIAYGLGGDCNCGEGALSMKENENGLVFTYHNTNRFAIKAWERAPQGISCMKTGKIVLAYLLKLGLYSKDEVASIIVPEWNDNIKDLEQKILDAEGCNCKKGFFKLISENGYYKVKYEKNNPYIKPEWDKITENHLCDGVASGLYGILKAYKKTITLGSNAISLSATPSAKEELNRKFQIIDGINCGDDFFVTYDRNTYILILVSTFNRHIKKEWATVKT